MPKDFARLVRLTKSVLDAEKQVDKEREQLHKLLDESTDGYWDWHIPTDYEYMSPKFWEILGQDYTKMRHHPDEWMKLVHPDDLSAIKTNIQNHFASHGSKTYIQEVRYFMPDGTIKWILCKGKVIEWDGDKPVRMVGTHSDISELKAKK